jgi:hypothetical protein
LATPALQQSKSANAKLLADAVEAGNIAAAEGLLSGVADIDAANETRTTALMRAAKFGHLELVHVLLNKGTDINQENNEGFTALFFAVFFGHKDVVKLLLQRGADPAIGTRIQTSLEMWANTRGFFDIAGLLTDFPSTGSREASEAASTKHSIMSPTSSAADEKVETHVEKHCALGNSERTPELKKSSGETLEVSHVRAALMTIASEMVPPAPEAPIVSKADIYTPGHESLLINEPSRDVGRGRLSSLFVRTTNRYQSAITAEYDQLVASVTKKTSDWRRVTIATLILILVCSGGTILFLQISDKQAKSQTALAPKPGAAHAPLQIQGSSLPRVATFPLRDVSESSASAERDATEHFFEIRSPSAAKAAEVHKRRTDELYVSSDLHFEKRASGNLKQTQGSKGQDRGSSANTTLSILRAGATSKTATSQSPAGSRKSEPNAELEFRTAPAPVSVEAQRPRSVESRTESKPTSSETNSPIVLRAKSPKTKVIQWP